MKNPLNNICVVLVHTSHPGNIGSVARGMKNMGIEQLVLVSPKSFPDAEATALASGADDILAKAKVVQTLDEAIADCHLVAGTSARRRDMEWPLVTPKEGAKELVSVAQNNRVALVFGNEQSGLSNEELSRCHYHIHISTSEAYSSLNLAAAALVCAYECRMAVGDKIEPSEKLLASGDSVKQFFDHLEETLIFTGYLKTSSPGKLMHRLRRLFSRAKLEDDEVSILRGILRSVMK